MPKSGKMVTPRGLVPSCILVVGAMTTE